MGDVAGVWLVLHQRVDQEPAAVGRDVVLVPDADQQRTTALDAGRKQGDRLAEQLSRGDNWIGAAINVPSGARKNSSLPSRPPQRLDATIGRTPWILSVGVGKFCT